MATCPSCGFEYEGSFKFCPDCGATLGVPTRTLGEERKVVTSLFCDLVAFTATSESADPEDVNTMLAAYFAMARKEIEAFGGVVEKFIGDAVVGVFGVLAAQPEQRFACGSSVGGALVQQLDADRELNCQTFAELRRDLRHPVVGGGALPELRVHLLGTEGRLTPRRDRVGKLIGREVVDGRHVLQLRRPEEDGGSSSCEWVPTSPRP